MFCPKRASANERRIKKIEKQLKKVGGVDNARRLLRDHSLLGSAFAAVGSEQYVITADVGYWGTSYGSSGTALQVLCNGTTLVFVFHPGYTPVPGAARIDGVFGNQDMGFVPEPNVYHHMTITLGADGNNEFRIEAADGSNVWAKEFSSAFYSAGATVVVRDGGNTVLQVGDSSEVSSSGTHKFQLTSAAVADPVTSIDVLNDTCMADLCLAATSWKSDADTLVANVTDELNTATATKSDANDCLIAIQNAITSVNAAADQWNTVGTQAGNIGLTLPDFSAILASLNSAEGTAQSKFDTAEAEEAAALSAKNAAEADAALAQGEVDQYGC
eukprot:TRINITY_DN6171_c0_g1_i2.p1 TRINITY_DN6171_c0_g1~~TRINITY_DN6171_c0_g1_i2.p1  ORF type:complete len:347 (+),score=91.55 TRINITY_DN6171_c0_g1_i2:54-1043(+)